VAEVGRQPWAIQDLLPVGIAASQLSQTAVVTTFCIFAVLFTLLLAVEVRIMCKAISEHKQ
jgi:cytochrome d ubiquinol oxidase subunit I